MRTAATIAANLLRMQTASRIADNIHCVTVASIMGRLDSHNEQTIEQVNGNAVWAFVFGASDGGDAAVGCHDKYGGHRVLQRTVEKRKACITYRVSG